MHTLVIITAAVQTTANSAAKAHFDPVGGELTFSVGLVTPPNLDAITHYWCAASFSPANRALLNAMTAQSPFAGNVEVFDYDADNNPGFPHAKLADFGLALFTSP